ncbi:hypothetical protein Tco_0010175 [Tanacetum coccineum]
MANNQTMAQLLQAPTEGYEDAIVIPEINDNFELKHDYLNNEFLGLSTTPIKLMLFPFSLEEIYREKIQVLIPETRQSLQSEFEFSYSRNFTKFAELHTTEVSELKNMMKTMLVEKQRAQAPTPVKAVEQSCVTCEGAHSYRNCPATNGNIYQDNIQEYVSHAAAANFNQGNTNSRPPMVANQIRPPGFPPI